jgi:hypothetical protein
MIELIVFIWNCNILKFMSESFLYFSHGIIHEHLFQYVTLMSDFNGRSKMTGWKFTVAGAWACGYRAHNTLACFEVAVQRFIEVILEKSYMYRVLACWLCPKSEHAQWELMQVSSVPFTRLVSLIPYWQKTIRRLSNDLSSTLHFSSRLVIIYYLVMKFH